MTSGGKNGALQLHATGIAIDGLGVALVGKSGSGKSDLALRLIDRGAVLVCDDRLELIESVGKPWICTCANIKGQIEVRGLGIIPMTNIDAAPLHLIIDLDRPPERFPDPWPHRVAGGFAVPELWLNAREAGAAIKVEIALRWLVERGMLPTRHTAAKS